MNILFWFLFTLFTIYWIFRLFGPYILRFAMKQLMKRAVQNMAKEQQKYEQHYNREAYEDNVYMDNEVKVSAPRYTNKQKYSWNDVAEDISFEEDNR